MPVDQPLIALVGGDTLLAKEIRELLSEHKPAPRVQLISAAADGSAHPGSGKEAEEEEETVIMTPLTPESLAGAQAVLLAGSAAFSRRTLKLNLPERPPLIDLTGVLEDQPDARLRAPLAEPAPPLPPAAMQVIAHPAAIAIARFLSALAARYTIRRSIVHVFEPASERGQKGLDELQQQTVAVLSFQKQKTDVFDTQAAFNVLAQYGEEALEPLSDIEQRLERHLASLLSAWHGVPMPSIRLVQVPVFHGHSISLWVEFDQNPEVEELSAALTEAGIDVRPDEPPSNVGIAGQSGLSAGTPIIDRNQPRAAWFWLVADNLRLAAENAIAVAREML